MELELKKVGSIIDASHVSFIEKVECVIDGHSVYLNRMVVEKDFADKIREMTKETK